MYNGSVGYSRVMLLIFAFLAEGIVLLAALLLARYFDINLLPLTESLFRDILIGTFGALLPLAFFVFSLSKKAENIPLIGSLKKTVITNIKEVFSRAQLFDIFVISLFAGFAEELLFRGVVQHEFGIIIASILFGLVHLVTPAYVVVAAIMGCYIGGFFYLYDSLLIPIQMHFIYDLGALIYLRYFVKEELIREIPLL